MQENFTFESKNESSGVGDEAVLSGAKASNCVGELCNLVKQLDPDKIKNFFKNNNEK